MKIAAHVLGYNVTRFIKPVLENIEPHVDKIYIAHAELPFGYIEKSRQTSRNPTSIADIKAASSSPKIEIVSGDWMTEEAMRNSCLEKARADGFDWFIIQDADEFYSEASWKQIKNILQNNKSDDHFTTTWYNFWKSSRFVMVNMNGSMKGTNAGFAVRCSSKLKFADRRRCDTNITRVIDCPCYHYSYVMSDQEMREKITTWSHAHEVFSTSWFKYKWLNWTESTRWLNPVFPTADERAISFPLEQPEFAEQFAMPINKLGGEIPKFSMLAGDAIYDAKVGMFRARKSVSRVVKSLFV